MTDNKQLHAFFEYKNRSFGGLIIIVLHIIQLLFTFAMIGSLEMEGAMPLMMFFAIVINIVMIGVGVLALKGIVIRNWDMAVFYLELLFLILIVLIIKGETLEYNELGIKEMGAACFIIISGIYAVWAFLVSIIRIFTRIKFIINGNTSSNTPQRIEELKEQVFEINKEIAEINRSLGEGNNGGIIPNIIGGNKILSVNGIKDIFKDHNPLAK